MVARQRRVVLSQIRVPVHPQTKPVFGALTSVHCPLLSTTLLQGFPMHSLISSHLLLVAFKKVPVPQRHV